MSMSPLFLILSLLSASGGNDLLDYLPTKSYWESKNVQVSPAVLITELDLPADTKPLDVPKLIKDLGDPDFNVRQAAEDKLAQAGPAASVPLEAAANSTDPEVASRAKKILQLLAGAGDQALAVRRLMAIRTLGELKSPDALPVLKKLLDSKRAFESDYAAQAVAAIEGKPCSRPAPDPVSLDRDLWLLPKGVGVVAQTSLSGRYLPLDQFLAQADDLFPDPAQKEQAVKQFTAYLLQFVERTGNIRLQAATLALSSDIGGRTGFVVLIARGRYSASSVSQTLKAEGVKSQVIEGAEVLMPERSMMLVLPSDDTFVLMAAAPSQPELLPSAQLLAALKSGKGSLADDPEMAKLILAQDRSKPLWAVCRVSDKYREASFLKPFDSLVLSSEKTPEGLTLKLTAEGKDADAVKAAVAEVQGYVQQALDGLKQQEGRQQAAAKAFAPFVDFLQSVTFQTEGPRATLSASLKGSPTSALAPLFLFSMRSF